MSDDAVEMNLSGLEGLIRLFKAKPVVGKLGILAKTNARRDDTHLTNVMLGVKHEYGEEGMPMRSWLRMPVYEKLYKYLESVGTINEELIKKCIKEVSTAPIVEEMCIGGEVVIEEAFRTQGYGKWPSWKTPGYTNRTGKVLLDTKQLSQAVTSEVVT